MPSFLQTTSNHVNITLRIPSQTDCSSTILCLRYTKYSFVRVVNYDIKSGFVISFNTTNFIICHIKYAITRQL